MRRGPRACVTIDFNGGDGPRGHVSHDGSTQAFAGWLELLALLHRVADDGRRQEQAAAPTAAGVVGGPRTPPAASPSPRRPRNDKSKLWRPT